MLKITVLLLLLVGCCSDIIVNVNIGIAIYYDDAKPGNGALEIESRRVRLCDTDVFPGDGFPRIDKITHVSVSDQIVPVNFEKNNGSYLMGGGNCKYINYNCRDSQDLLRFVNITYACGIPLWYSYETQGIIERVTVITFLEMIKDGRFFI
jgi:hypothetical protein